LDEWERLSDAPDVLELLLEADNTDNLKYVKQRTHRHRTAIPGKGPARNTIGGWGPTGIRGSILMQDFPE
jgi:hypothetical protein